MTIDATKKQPTTETSELQEFELEYQIRLRAYELYEQRGREDGHAEGRLAACERRNHAEEGTNRHRLINAPWPDISGPFYVRRSLHII
jgi:hypothetical protein